MRLVLLGAPGSGKGTQATRLKDALAVPHISTGDLLRAAVAAGTPLGTQAKAVMDRGELVSDDIVLGMLEERLTAGDTGNGFILDGYPRNSAQAQALESLLAKLGQPVDVAVLLDVDVELLNTRFTPINLAESPAVAADGTIARPDVIPVAVAEQDGSASLPFYARYYATDAAKAGKVAAYVNFTVVYP